MAEPVSFVRACRTFFETPPHARKVEIPEFKALSHEDKVELREMLIAEGIDVAELVDVNSALTS